MGGLKPGFRAGEPWDWPQFKNFCAGENGEDLRTTAAGRQTLALCKSACAQDLGCSAIEWYARGLNRPSDKCYLVLGAIHGNPDYQGAATTKSAQPRYKSATCHTRPLGKSAACVCACARARARLRFGQRPLVVCVRVRKYTNPRMGST